MDGSQGSNRILRKIISPKKTVDGRAETMYVLCRIKVADKKVAQICSRTQDHQNDFGWLLIGAKPIEEKSCAPVAFDWLYG